jgi:hypothetical protein
MKLLELPTELFENITAWVSRIMIASEVRFSSGIIVELYDTDKSQFDLSSVAMSFGGTTVEASPLLLVR